MKFHLAKASIFILLISSCLAQSALTHSKKFIYPFDAIQSDVLEKYIHGIADEKRIIGLGEVSHFTRECYLLKHEIIQSLIEKGYDGLILEVDFGQALIWNEYVTEGKGDLDVIISQSGWFTYRTEEFKNLIRDIKTHNENAEVPFQIFGMEMTAMNHNIDWLKNYFKENAAQATEIMRTLDNERKIVAFHTHSKEEKQDYWELHYQVSNFLNEHEEKLIAQGGEKKYSIAQRIAEITRQYATYISHDDFGLKSEFRDQFSARNVRWCLQEMGEDSQAIIWAHNGHIAKESILFNYDILGHYLSQWFEDEYHSIGFTFNKGEFGAFSNNGFKRWNMPAVDTTSLTQEFQAFSSPYLVFDIKNNLKADKDLNSPLRSDQLIRTDVSESFNDEWPKYMNINLSRTYDALIYIDETSFPTAIDWSK